MQTAIVRTGVAVVIILVPVTCPRAGGFGVCAMGIGWASLQLWRNWDSEEIHAGVPAGARSCSAFKSENKATMLRLERAPVITSVFIPLSSLPEI